MIIVFFTNLGFIFVLLAIIPIDNNNIVLTKQTAGTWECHNPWSN